MNKIWYLIENDPVAKKNIERSLKTYQTKVSRLCR